MINGYTQRGITWIGRGVALGYINVAPLGLEDHFVGHDLI